MLPHERSRHEHFLPGDSPHPPGAPDGSAGPAILKTIETDSTYQLEGAEMNADSMKSPASRLERATKTMNSLVSSGWKARKWVAASLLALAALPIASPSTASAGTVVGRGFAEYYVMGDEVDLINSFKSIPSGGVSGAATAANVRSRLSIVSSSGDVSV